MSTLTKKLLPYTINVLNAGYVELLDFMGGDKAIVEAARVCFQTEGNEKSDQMLIKSLIRKKHTSPFEHCTIRFKVKLPLFVHSHWVKHRIGVSLNTKSLRYCEAKPDFFVPSEIAVGTSEYKAWLSCFNDAFAVYQGWIKYFVNKGFKKNRARELARTKLPTEIYTEMLVTMNAASLMHFLNLRGSNHAQKETQLYAKALLECAKIIAPVTFDCYEELNSHLSDEKLVINEQSSDTSGYEQLIFM